ncbi:threonine/homoserine/homoserine lactone efflux protein [Sinorhizobium terangae]|uniref:LysE family translocator n=1 Tax=Sinorhizobium terangae TaxID=110322 RepID=A0A6N7LC40_SINTE|nr:LysE family transporter [Sinorhizobium terangae]MBB4184189.1 threonine/homoserine/homoserine lactone efflux protein [Sinorhizobium terangae]MQX14798.1 LysE family translocator [Sinorhizobium terangae]
MAGDLALLVLAALPLMGSPGPATLSLAGMGAAHGVRLSAHYAAGVNIGTIAVVLAIAAGVTAVILELPGMKPALMVLAGAYMIYLAWHIATAPPVATEDQGSNAPSFLSGLVLAIANPKAYAAIGAVYAGSATGAGEGAMAKVIALSILAIVVNTTWLWFGAAMAAILHDPRKARVANLIFAFLLLASIALPLLR